MIRGSTSWVTWTGSLRRRPASGRKGWARPDAAAIVHNHPYYVTVLAAVGILPEIVHQTGSMFDGDLAFVQEYTGEVDDAILGARLAEQIGSARPAQAFRDAISKRRR